MALRFLLDYFSGDPIPNMYGDDPPRSLMTVEEIDDAVTVYGYRGRKPCVLGRARWVGDALVAQGETDRALDDWSKIAEAIRTARVALRSFPSAPAPRVAPDLATPQRSKPSSRGRSGWWAAGAALVALTAAAITTPWHAPSAIVLWVLGGGTGLYWLIGMGSQCAKCGAWFRSQIVSGNVLHMNGMTSTSYTYRCRECGHIRKSRR